MRKTNISQSLITIVMAFIAYLGMSSSALAHSGHDHAANEALLLHVLAYGSIAIAVSFVAWLAYRQFNQQKSK